MQYKYPRTPHLPWSPGATKDDKMLSTDNMFVGKEVVVTEKMDGENTTLYHNYLHARSVSKPHHPSQSWIKRMHSLIQASIPEGVRICGENLYAQHSIVYNDLESYFLMFNAWRGETCLSWDDTTTLAQQLGVTVVPVLYRGVYNREMVERCFTGRSVYGAEQEGYVVRVAESFSMSEFRDKVAKYVRKNHVTTDTHWTTSWQPNTLK